MEVKQKMVLALSQENEKEIEIDVENLKGKELDFFVSQKTKNFFERFEIKIENPEFCDGVALVKNLRVVNDLAERGVNLAQELTSVLTKSENQRQAIYQNVSEYRKKLLIVIKVL